MTNEHHLHWHMQWVWAAPEWLANLLGSSCIMGTAILVDYFEQGRGQMASICKPTINEENKKMPAPSYKNVIVCQQKERYSRGKSSQVGNGFCQTKT